MITAAQIALVQSSFGEVLPIADTAGLLFYERVFTLAPGTRSMFGDDIGLQATRTMAAVKTAVDGLGDMGVVGPFLVRLGARHVRYGVRTEHFDVVGTACSGRSSRASASGSQRRSATRGSPPGMCSPTPCERA